MMRRDDFSNFDFHFKVDPEVDVAIGAELHFEESAVAELHYDSYTDLKPQTPTEAKPGSEEKVRMLAARYAAGVSLWHNEDCYDHGPPVESVSTEPAYDDDDDGF